LFQTFYLPFVIDFRFNRLISAMPCLNHRRAIQALPTRARGGAARILAALLAITAASPAFGSWPAPEPGKPAMQQTGIAPATAAVQAPSREIGTAQSGSTPVATAQSLTTPATTSQTSQPAPAPSTPAQQPPVVQIKQSTPAAQTTPAQPAAAAKSAQSAAPAVSPAKPTPGMSGGQAQTAAPQSVDTGAAVQIQVGQSQIQSAPPAGPGGKLPPPSTNISFGLLAGGQLRDWFQTVQTGTTTFDDGSGRFMIGPTLRFNHKQLTFEVDALRRGFGARSAGSFLGIGFSSKSTGSSWEFPVLVKKQINRDKSFRIVMGLGAAFRYNMQNASVNASSNLSNTTSGSDRNLTLGIPFSFGTELKTGHFRIAPEFRYTLWTADKSLTLVRIPGLYDANSNQVALLFAFTFE
jgi:hypothetical protein